MQPRDLPRVPRFAANIDQMASSLVAMETDLDDIVSVKKTLWIEHGYWPDEPDLTRVIAIARATKASEGNLFGIVMAAILSVILFTLGMLLVGPAQAASHSVAYEVARVYALLAAVAFGVVLIIALVLDQVLRRRAAKERRS